MGCFRLWVAALILLLPFAERIRAQPTQSSYTVDRWTVEDGLPQNSVNDILQTPDRYLWLATRDGLARFDGFSFTTYTQPTTPALPSNRITELVEGRDGGLWIGTAEGLARYREESFTAVTDSAQGLHTYIRALARGPSGGVWIAPEGRLVRYRNGQFKTISERQFPALRPRLIKDLEVGPSGRLWILYADAVARMEADELRVFSAEDGLPEETLVAIGTDQSGQVWVGSKSGERVSFHNSEVGPMHTLPVGAETAREFLFEDRSGQGWMTSGTKIRAFRGQRVVFQYERTKAEAYPIQTLYEDRAGNVWGGSEGGGLFRLRRPLFSVYDAEDGLSYNVTLSLAQTPDRSIWVGTNCQGLNRLRDGQFATYTGPNVPSDACLYGVLAGTDGALWVGHEHLVRIKDGRSTRYRLPYQTPGSPERGDVVKALYEDPHREGTLWVGTIDGLYRVANGAVQQHYTTEDGLLAPRVQYILRAKRDSALWLSTRQGLSRLKNGTFTNFTTANGFPSSNPRALYEDREGTLWIGTYGDGLVRYQDGTFTAVSKADGLYDNVVSAIIPDSSGTLWMSGNRGIFRVQWADLDAFVEGRRSTVPSVGYGEAAGLKNPETNGGFQPSATTDRQGRIWFPTLQGVAMVDPSRIGSEERPAVHVKQVRYQNEPVPLSGPTNRLPMGRRSFEVTYTGINLSRPDAVRFQYRLAGFESEWQPAGARRTAFYTNVPPGTYSFRIRAANEEGAWSEPARLQITVPPYFYETTWFAVLCGLLGIGLVAGGYGARVYALRRRKEQLQRQVQKRTAELRAEKQRTADALDTVAEQKEAIEELNAAQSELFANVSHEFRTPLTVALGLLEEWVEPPSGSLPDAAHQDLRQVLLNNRRLLRLVNQLLDIARLESDTLDLQVQRVNLKTTLDHLAQAFVGLAERHDMTFQRELPNEEVWIAADPDQLETVVVNLLSNAFKYTPQGGRVTLTLTTADETVGIRVSDTGPGIPESEQEAIFNRFHQSDAVQGTGTGIGLSLTKALVERHGGTIGVESTVGEGSIFTVRLPRGTEHLADRPDVTWTEAPTSAAPGTDDVTVPAPVEESKEKDRSPRTDPDTLDADDRPTILVVDDHEDIRSYVGRHLSPRYRVVEAADGEAGLERARELTPDCVVSDVMMPRMDGVEMLTELRADPTTDFLPVIFLTAKAAMEDKLEGLDAGADDYLTKPFRPDELTTRIRNVIAQRMRLRERFQSEGSEAQDRTGRGEQKPHFLQKVEEAIRAHIGEEDLTVSMLAEAVGASRSKLYRKLGNVTDTSPGDLIWQVRLDEARILLQENTGNVSEVAYGVGFKSVSHFTNRFRERFGKPPSEVAS